MDFTYEIIDNKIRIINYIEIFNFSPEIPEFIDDYPVTDIKMSCFWCTRIREINGEAIKDGVNLINNKFIYYRNNGSVVDNLIFKIKYEIGDDCCSIYDGGYRAYFIENIFYNQLFNK